MIRYYGMSGPLLLLILGACKPIEVEKKSAPASTTDTAEVPIPTTTNSTAPPPPFQNPAEAIDLDPADGVLRVELVASAHTHSIGDESIAGYAYNGLWACASSTRLGSWR